LYFLKLIFKKEIYRSYPRYRRGARTQSTVRVQRAICRTH